MKTTSLPSHGVLYPHMAFLPSEYCPICLNTPLAKYHLTGLVCSPRERKIQSSIPTRAVWIFSGSSQTSDLKIGTPVATLPGAWRYGVSIGTGWPGVSILELGEVASLTCNFHPSVAACTILSADLSLRYLSMLLRCYATKKQQPLISCELGIPSVVVRLTSS